MMDNFERRHRQVRTGLQASLLTSLTGHSNAFCPMSPLDTAPLDTTEEILSVSSEEFTFGDCSLLDRTEQNTEAEQTNHLATVIIKRIQARLPGRIHRLAVKVTDNAVVLVGQCSTYYSKQLAQHAAMGVLDYQRLVNNISVRALR